MKTPMTNTEVVSQETEYQKNEGFEIVQPETFVETDYTYGLSNNTIDGEVAIRNLGGANYKIGYFTFNSTGNIAVTGVGFTPRLVLFSYSNQAGVNGNGGMDGTSQFGYEDSLGTQIQSECIYIRNSGGTAIGKAVYVSMDSDGFTINATLASATIYVNYTCFG